MKTCNCNNRAKVLAVTLTAPQLKGAFKMKGKRLILSALVALAGFLPQSKAALTLGSAASFGVLGATTVTSTGSTVVNGDVGLYPGALTSITGFYPPGIVNGTIYAADTVAQKAQADALTAYGNAAGQTPTVSYGSANEDLGGLTLAPGVYNDSTSFGITGTLTLDAHGNPNAVWIFQAGSTLTTASGPDKSSVVLINGAQACHVFWQVGSSATIGTYSDFAGTILASVSITADTGATVDGRLLALNGAVTLDDNLITVPTCIPEASSFWPGAFCASVFGWQWLGVWRRKTARS
jgi:hypothetical protein